MRRRALLGGMLATGLAPRAGWAELGRTAFLSAARRPDGAYVLCGLSGEGRLTFRLPLPARGHAAAAHPSRAEAVAFARRPGTYALVIDCASGAVLARLEAPRGRHFYGHGAFSADGALLFTTENDYAAARGVVGVWDARRGYQRLGAFGSGGVGPHDMRLMPDGASLVVANGGIETHPEAGRAKLNLPTMRAALCYLSLDGTLLDEVVLGPAHQRNSIRHLAVAGDGTVAFAMQWQGDLTGDLPLLSLHSRSRGALELIDAASVRRMSGYLGSVAITRDGTRLAVTSPRAGLVQVYRSGALQDERQISDVCGLATSGEDLVITSGSGLVQRMGARGLRHPVQWDNHLVPV
jgi:hypothetical protein